MFLDSKCRRGEKTRTRISRKPIDGVGLCRAEKRRDATIKFRNKFKKIKNKFFKNFSGNFDISTKKRLRYYENMARKNDTRYRY